MNSTSLLVEAARMYYEHNLSQQEISRRLGVSRPGVSRLLTRARQEGIVQINIIDPSKIGIQLERELKQKFSLHHAVIVPNTDESDSIIKKRLGIAAAKYLESIIEAGDIIGFSWGTTMLEVMRATKSPDTRDLTIVQLNGGVSRAEYDTHASEVTQLIGQKLRAVPYLLPLPAIVDNAIVKDAITSDKNINRTLTLAKESRITMFTIGLFNHNSVLYKADYFTKNQVDSLLQKGAVADICSRIIDHNGKICSSELNKRTIGIELNEIGKKEFAVAVAGGLNKLEAIRAGLKSKCFNVLITDELVARQLLKEMK